MGKLDRIHQWTGWLVFFITAVVLVLSAERTGSLWDVGEFILGAYKLQVVHPPGAPLFLLVGRLFAGVGDLLSSDPAMIAFAVNAMSAICTAFTATFVAWATIRLSILGYTGRDETIELGPGQQVATAGAGLVAGLATAFSSSIWFSAVEGEVYAMSLFFTAMTVWSMVRWYCKPDTPEADRWLLFTLFASGLSIGVHLLSILTWPALAVLYYFKTNKKEFSWLRLGVAVLVGVGIFVFIQRVIIVGIPQIWHFFEVDLGLVNAGLPVHIGILPTLLLLGGIIYWGLRRAHRTGNARLQQAMVGFVVLIIANAVVGVVVLRAEAKTPVNMNNPDNVTSLLPYLNREQYGERSLLFGPNFDAEVVSTDVEPRMGLVNGKYEETNYKITPVYDKRNTGLFPRMSDGTQGRPRLYKQWMGLDPDADLPRGRPNFADNVKFLFNYQLGWMYWRYFMWNFSGRQNGEQGYYSWDESSGNWITGIDFLDELRLGNLDELPEEFRNDPARNTYFLIPLIFGLIGLFWHAGKRQDEFLALLTLFVITGIGITIYTNQPPNEPRERDYVLAGSFFVFCMWMGMAIPAIYELVKKRLNQKGFGVAAGVTALVLSAPLLMGFQNWDDHSRALHTGSRDYASNFLNSVDENAIIFTYGDNDTYPLWYAQEVEGIRTDVRVVNLSLIAVDWYIDLLRYKMNDSPPINLSLTQDQVRGRKRNQIPYNNPANADRNCARDRQLSLNNFMEMVAADNPVRTQGGGVLETTYNSCNVVIDVDQQQLAQAPWLIPDNGGEVASRIPVRISNSRLLKDDIAILDIINSNLYDRPIYWAVTCQRSKMMGLEDYLQLEGLALKLTTVRNSSEQNYGIIGSGGIDADKNYDLVMNTWRYGNFDKVDTHINTSYGPAIQSMQISVMRTMNTLLAEGETEKALALGEKYFQSFPNMNFPFYYQAALMIQPYVTAGQVDRISDVVIQLAENTAARLDFYTSLDEQTMELSYARDFQIGRFVVERLLSDVRPKASPELQGRLDAILGNYKYLVPGQQPAG